MNTKERMPNGEVCDRVGYAFVPIQKVTKYYDHESAMVCGTIFPELCIPKGKYGPKENAQM